MKVDILHVCFWRQNGLRKIYVIHLRTLQWKGRDWFFRDTQHKMQREESNHFASTPLDGFGEYVLVVVDSLRWFGLVHQNYIVIKKNKLFSDIFDGCTSF